MRLPQNRELVEIVPLAELYSTYANHKRLKVFAKKGRKCVACGREGTFVIISKELPSKRRKKNSTVGRRHVDLFTDDFILMTVDHIVPKKVGKELNWSKNIIESLDNKQTMCEPCNNRKGSKQVTNDELAERVKYPTNSQRRTLKKTPFSGACALRDLVENFHRLNGDYTILDSPEKSVSDLLV